MKHSRKHIAEAMAILAADPNVDLDALSEEAVTLLRREHPGKSVRGFPRMVENMLQRKGSTVFATLTTPEGHSPDAKHLQELLADALGKPVQLLEKADAHMIGGAMLTVGDERFDLSLKGSLNHLVDSLKTSLAS